MNTFKTRNLVLYLSIAVLLISVGFSVSYAYLYATVTGNDDVNDMVIRAGNVEVNFNTTSYINSSSGKILLIPDADRATKALKSTFTVNVVGTSTLDARYDIYLTDFTISSNLKNGDLKYELLKNGVTVGQISDFSTATSGEDFKLNSAVQSITNGSTDNYELRIWLSMSDANQNNLLTGSQFSGKLKVKATPYRAS